jgi:hypothetical protein
MEQKPMPLSQLSSLSQRKTASGRSALYVITPGRAFAPRSGRASPYGLLLGQVVDVRCDA